VITNLEVLREVVPQVILTEYLALTLRELPGLDDVRTWPASGLNNIGFESKTNRDRGSNHRGGIMAREPCRVILEDGRGPVNNLNAAKTKSGIVVEIVRHGAERGSDFLAV
jgi:hypothetical protein